MGMLLVLYLAWLTAKPNTRLKGSRETTSNTNKKGDRSLPKIN